MPTFCDLPGSALQLILVLAVGRRVLGINKYTRVCRPWRAASHAWDWEQLRLVLDLDAAAIQHVDLHDAILWLTTYGHQVQHFSIRCYQQPSFPVLQQLWVAPKRFCSLVRLEVDGKGTLVDLAPLLPQLTKLRHLKASISLREDAGCGVFHPGGWQPALPAIPNLEELCPQLQSLHLVIHSSSAWMDPRLSQLLPCGLQQLQLEVVGPAPAALDPVCLAGCTALQQLLLQNVDIINPEALTDLDHIPIIRMVDVFVPDGKLLQMKDKLVQYTSRTELYWDDPQTPGQLTALTALTSRHYEGTTFDEFQLIGLLALQQLELVGVDDFEGSQLPLVLQQLAGLPQLRSLRLEGDFVQAAVTAFTAVKQLTALHISEMGVWCASEWDEQQEVLQMQQLLQQLPGLQRLEVHPGVVTKCHQPWWTGLTALTQLMVTHSQVLDPVQMSDCLTSIIRTLRNSSVPPNLEHLVFKAVPWQHEAEVLDPPPRCSRDWSRVEGAAVTCWEVPSSMLMDDLPLPGTPCPWLPGVWEVPGDPK
jgi:hypothetical protein